MSEARFSLTFSNGRARGVDDFKKKSFQKSELFWQSCSLISTLWYAAAIISNVSSSRISRNLEGGYEFDVDVELLTDLRIGEFFEGRE